MDTLDSTHDRRQNVRFSPEPLATAMIASGSDIQNFKVQAHALIVDESFGGAGLVMLLQESLILQTGDLIVVKVGALHPMRAEVRWVLAIDTQVIKLGVMYLDSYMDNLLNV